MMRAIQFTLLFALILACACTGRRGVQAAGQSTTRKIAVSTATARLRTVPAAFEETGSFVADESSDIAPPVPTSFREDNTDASMSGVAAS